MGCIFVFGGGTLCKTYADLISSKREFRQFSDNCEWEKRSGSTVDANILKALAPPFLGQPAGPECKALRPPLLSLDTEHMASRAMPAPACFDATVWLACDSQMAIQATTTRLAPIKVEFHESGPAT